MTKNILSHTQLEVSARSCDGNILTDQAFKYELPSSWRRKHSHLNWNWCLSQTLRKRHFTNKPCLRKMRICLCGWRRDSTNTCSFAFSLPLQYLPTSLWLSPSCLFCPFLWTSWSLHSCCCFYRCNMLACVLVAPMLASCWPYGQRREGRAGDLIHPTQGADIPGLWGIHNLWHLIVF